MKKQDTPIFDQSEQIFHDIIMQCNDCKKLDEKIDKTRRDYAVKKRGVSVIKNQESKKNMLENLDREYFDKLDRLERVKKRSCADGNPSEF